MKLEVQQLERFETDDIYVYYGYYVTSDHASYDFTLRVLRKSDDSEQYTIHTQTFGEFNYYSFHILTEFEMTDEEGQEIYNQLKKQVK